MFGVLADGVLVLAMGGYQHAGFREDGAQGFHPVYQHVARAGSHEQLHAAYPGLVQFLQQVDIVVGRSEVEGIVDDAFGGGVGKLLFQGFQRGGLGVAVRHVHEGGHASGCGSGCFGGHVRLVGQARVTEMHVVVNDTWNEVTAVGVYLFVARAGRAFVCVKHFADDFVFYDYGTGKAAAFVHDKGVVYPGTFHDNCLSEGVKG